MRGALPILVMLTLLPTAAAQSASPPPGTVWTVLTTVDAVVEGNYAVVKVIADIGNRGPDPEFPFRVRVPDDAFVTGLTIERDGKVFEARIEDRQKAREEYEEWKAQGQTGGLVEKQRHSSVFAYLINVAEFTSVRATLTYERYLAADRGIYNLSLDAPVSGFGEDLGARFHVTLRDASTGWGIEGGTLQRTSEGVTITYDVGPRGSDASTPFTVSYTMPATGDAGEILTVVRDGVGYFVHRFRAEAGERTMPVDLVLVLDVSGSMSGLKMQQMQDAATQVLQMLGPEDRLHLAFFSSDASAAWSGMRATDAETRKLAAREIQDALAAGGTNIQAGLETGFRALGSIDWREEEGRLPALVLLTDGRPTSGVVDHASLRDLAKQANAHDAAVFAIAFGSDADWSLVHALATDADGTALRVPEGQGAEVDIQRFIRSLTTPVLKDVRVDYPAGVNASRTGADILFAGSELLIVGTFDPALAPLRGTVHAMTPDGAVEYGYASRESSGLSFLPRVVASREIARIQANIDAEGERTEWVARVTELGVKHGFVTDYTSLVLTLDPRAAPRPGCEDCEVVTLAEGSADGRAHSVDSAGAPSASVTPAQLRTTNPPPTGTTTATRVDAYAPTPEAKVPGPGVALALLAVLVVALALRSHGRKEE